MAQKHRLVMALISLLVAGVLWLYVVSSIAPETTGTVGSIPVSIDGGFVLEERNLIVTNQLTTSVSLELRTSRLNFSKLSAENIRISADASKLREPGTYELSYTINFPDTVNSNDIEILRKSSSKVTITVAQLVTKKVPVRLNWSGEVEEGYLFEAESAVIEPLEVTLTGPDYELDPVSEAVINFDVTGLDITTIETLPLSFVNSAGEACSFSSFTAFSASEARLTLPILRTKQLTLAVELIPGGGVKEENAKCTLDVESIRVKGSSAVIEALEDELVVGEVLLSTIEDKEESYEFALALPVGVTNMSGVSSVNATVEITGVQRSVVATSDIRVVNRPHEYDVEIANRTVNVPIRGTQEEIDKLQKHPEDLYIVVDLSGYTQTGAFTVPGLVYLQNHDELGVVDEVEISVHISVPREEEQET